MTGLAGAKPRGGTTQAYCKKSFLKSGKWYKGVSPHLQDRGAVRADGAPEPGRDLIRVPERQRPHPHKITAWKRNSPTAVSIEENLRQ